MEDINQMEEQTVCPKCGKINEKGSRFCRGCGSALSDINYSFTENKTENPEPQMESEPEPEMYFDQEENDAAEVPMSEFTEEVAEELFQGDIPAEPEEVSAADGMEAPQEINGIPNGARCRYCLGPISQENGECLLCHRPYFEKTEVPEEEEEVKDTVDNNPKVDEPKEPRCRYCNGKISEETGRCLLCNKPYNSTEEESNTSSAPKPKPVPKPAPKPTPRTVDDPFERIKNSNTRYKEDLEKYGTSAGSYNGNVLFDRVGRKIMGLAKAIFWIITIINLLISIYLIILAIKAESPGTAVAGIIVAIVGVIVGWLSSVLLYGYGQLIDAQQDTVEELSEIKHLLRKSK